MIDTQESPVVKDLFRIACTKYSTSTDKIVSLHGCRDLTKARKFIIKTLREKYNYSYTMIWKILKRDHTTILYYYKN